MQSLSEEVAWVTGASRGIGRACAEALAEAGARVALSARDEGALAEVAEAIRRAGGRAEIFPLDLLRPEAVPGCAEAIEARLGPVSVVVNNAGVAHAAPIAATTLDDLRRLLDVNLVGAFQVIQAALPGMLRRGRGRVVNVASSAGRTGHRYTAAYTASKHALVGLTRALAVELATRGVTVNAICPGWTETDLLATAAENVSRATGRTLEEARTTLARMNPMGRLIHPEEIARAVVFLADPLAGGITGQLLGIDAGEVIA